MRKSVKADMMLLIVTLCWGVSYIMVDISLKEVGPFMLNAYRFLIAFFVAALVSFKKIASINKTTLKYSFIIGTVLFLVYNGTTFGVKYTSLSNAGFLCAMTVVFVPIFEFLFLRKKPKKKVILTVLLSFTGIAFLTLGDNFSFNPNHIKGDLFSLSCAVFYAIDILITDRALKDKNVDAFQLGVFQLLFTGVWMLIASLMLETPAVPKSNVGIFSIVFLAIFCTGIAFIVQAIAQQYTTPSHVGIIFTLEPVFAGFAAYVFAGEVLRLRAYFGASLMLISLFLTEMDLSFISKKIKRSQKS